MLMKTFKIWLVFVLFFFGGYGVSAMAQDDMVFQYKGNFSSMEKDGWVCNNRAVIGTDRLTLEQKATGAGLELEWDGKKLECEPGSAIIVEVNKQEFLNLKLFPEKTGMSIACATRVLLKNHDFGKFIGVHFLERGEGTCKARLDIRPEHMNPIGTVHGGCLFTLADAVCGIAASSMGGICTTVNSNIQFLNAAFGPKYLIAEAKPKKLGRKIRSFLIEIRDDRDVLICTVDMVFYSLQN